MNTTSRIQRILVVAILLTPACNVLAQTQNTAADRTPAATSSTTAQSTKAVDRKLAHRVANALARTNGLNSARILVKARGAQITLSGSVTDSAQIPLAVESAKQVDGVSYVKNLIRVAGPSL